MHLDTVSCVKHHEHRCEKIKLKITKDWQESLEICLIMSEHTILRMYLKKIIEITEVLIVQGRSLSHTFLLGKYYLSNWRYNVKML
jgi:hypothetical protein